MFLDCKHVECPSTNTSTLILLHGGHLRLALDFYKFSNFWVKIKNVPLGRPLDVPGRPPFSRVMLVHLGRPLDVQMKVGTDGPKMDVLWTSDGRRMPTGLGL